MLRAIARDAMDGRPPFTGPVELKLCAYIPIPKGFTRAMRADALAGRLLPTVKPDASNIQKLCEDAILPPHRPRPKKGAVERPLTSVQQALRQVVLQDDSQIVKWSGWKLYSKDPRVVLEVSEIVP